MKITYALLGLSLPVGMFLCRWLGKRHDRAQDLREHEDLANFSHELRTPLSVLAARLEAMRDGIRPLNAEQLGLLAGSVTELEDLIDQFHQLALAETGRLACHADHLTLEPIIQAGLDDIGQRLTDRGLTLVSRLTPDIDVLGDAKHLRQMLRYLLDNCERYTEAGGSVIVTLQAHHGQATLSITDTGPGVSETQRRSLFERFYRTDTSRSRTTGGRGLGLALVRALAEAQGGKVRAFHSPEGGLGIAITLPLAPVN